MADVDDDMLVFLLQIAACSFSISMGLLVSVSVVMQIPRLGPLIGFVALILIIRRFLSERRLRAWKGFFLVGLAIGPLWWIGHRIHH